MASAASQASADNPLTTGKEMVSDTLPHGAPVLGALWRESKHTVAPRAAIGVGSGFLATGAMTAAMLTLQQLLPKPEQYPLPPRRIVAHVAQRLGIRRDLDKTSLDALTAVAHFGYGSSMGALYAPVALALPLPGVVSGVAWGLIVWTGSYLGLLPALNLLSSATRHPAKRNALMIAAHVVWGASLGILAQQIANRLGQD